MRSTGMKNLIILIVMIVLCFGGCSSKRPIFKIEGEISKSPTITPFYDKYWVLLEDLTFEFHKKKSTQKYQIKVPVGFVTDLASVPVGVNVVFDHYGRYSTAGIIHDYLYWVQPCGRKFADRMFRDVLKACGVSWRDRYSMWSGLKGAGLVAWEKKKKLRKKGESRFVPANYRDKISPDKRWSDFRKECCSTQADWEKIDINSKPEYCSIIDEKDLSYPDE
jgi:hypothetical protein